MFANPITPGIRYLYETPVTVGFADFYRTALVANERRKTDRQFDVLLKAGLLFLMNAADALLTLYWLNINAATEDNLIMNSLIRYNEFVFLGVKLLMGAVCFTLFYKWYATTTVKYGLAITLAAYGVVMGVHTFTGVVTAVSGTMVLLSSF